MRVIFAALLGGIFLSGCTYIDSFGGVLGPNAADIIAEAEDKSMEEFAERIEDVCEVLPQEDLDRFFAGTNDRADRRSDGTYPGLADQAINCSRQ